MNNPSVKLNMRYTKKILILKAQERGINTYNKTKLQLAKKISDYDEQEHTRIWLAIANGK